MMETDEVSEQLCNVGVIKKGLGNLPRIGP